MATGGEGKKLTATALVVASALCFGSISILTVLGTTRGTSLNTLMIGRYGIAIIVLGLILWRSGLLRIPARRAVQLMVFYGGAQAAVAFLSLISLAYIPAAMMSFLFYTFPATVAITAAITRIERLTRLRVVALAMSLTGIVLMVGAPWAMAASARGVLLALGAGTVYALYVVSLNRFQSDVPPMVATTYISLGALIIFILLGFGMRDITWNPHPVAIACMFALAILSTVLAFRWFLRGLSMLGSVRTSIVSTIEPFWTAILGAVVLSQPISGGTLAGGVLIAAAVILLQLGRE